MRTYLFIINIITNNEEQFLTNAEIQMNTNSF
jgi:hypothetical protein